ncbi:hypothetical protein FSARC_4579 [Fusarium sarcochroum]|uniref:IBR domain-containing protein n=1 Tax=Fusarium sarcochroum TaxID=1208366 RepID=A0A8H4XAI1_9HYPO|nr:hypothetical protein FSARC_4579 [Fusarium sarcochroum]
MDNDDDESLKLAIQLQREDLELWQARQGKRRIDDISQDSELVAAACREELGRIECQLSDRALGRSISTTVQENAAEIAAITADEQEAARDREWALRLSRDPEARRTPPQEVNNQQQRDEQPVLHEEIIERSTAPYIAPRSSDFAHRNDYNDHGELPLDESSAWAASRRQQTIQCVSCFDELPEPALSQAPCSHHYCQECLITLVQNALRDEGLFPPRCCTQTIPIEDGNRFLTPELVGQYRAKKLEFETPNRTYCHDPTCGVFVPPDFIEADTGTCPSCNKKTCVLCKDKTHAGVCPEDTASQELLRLAQAEGWQRCSSCDRVMDLMHGCNHISKSILKKPTIPPEPNILSPNPSPTLSY